MSNNKFKLSLAEHESVFADLNDDTFDGRSPVERPKAVILGGQPGAGKSKLSEIMQQNVFGDSSNVVKINGDDYREAHPQIREIGEENDKMLAEYTDPDVRDWTKRLFDKAISERFNIVFEGTLRNPAPIMETMQRMAALGYEIHVACMAVNPKISKVSTFLRYETQKRSVGYGRWTNPAAHDVTVENLPSSLNLIEQNSPISSLSLYNRDGDCLYKSSGTSKKSSDMRASDVLLREWNRPLNQQEQYQLVGSVSKVLEFMKQRRAKEEEFDLIKPHIPFNVLFAERDAPQTTRGYYVVFPNCNCKFTSLFNSDTQTLTVFRSAELSLAKDCPAQSLSDVLKNKALVEIRYENGKGVVLFPREYMRQEVQSRKTPRRKPEPNTW